MEQKSCCFIGHRKINESEFLKKKLFVVIESLIKNGVTAFLFGSRSEFDSLCHDVVTELKEKYPEIIRIAYDTKSESSTLEENRIESEKLYSKLIDRKIRLSGYERVIKPDEMWKTGKASYIERNRIMIDNSYYCVFYYDENYTPERRLISRKNISGLWTSNKSGTALSYKYAERKGKRIINVFI